LAGIKCTPGPGRLQLDTIWTVHMHVYVCLLVWLVFYSNKYKSGFLASIQIRELCAQYGFLANRGGVGGAITCSPFVKFKGKVQFAFDLEWIIL